MYLTVDQLPDISHRGGHWEAFPDPHFPGTWFRAIIPGEEFIWTPDDCLICDGPGCTSIANLGDCTWCSDHMCHGCGSYVS